VRSLGVIPNRSESIRKLLKKLEPAKELRLCYEAGPTGYAVYWQLTALGVACEVVAPTLVPMRAADRVKTDRRDGLKLARSYRAGDLTAVWVPDAAHEALRDLVRDPSFRTGRDAVVIVEVLTQGRPAAMRKNARPASCVAIVPACGHGGCRLDVAVDLTPHDHVLLQDVF
jgi:Transposase